MRTVETNTRGDSTGNDGGVGGSKGTRTGLGAHSAQRPADVGPPAACIHTLGACLQLGYSGAGVPRSRLLIKNSGRPLAVPVSAAGRYDAA
jgi:hypothetical protein